MEFTFFDTPTLLFWLLWLATLIICVVQVLRASATQTGVLGLVRAFCLMFAFFYVLQGAIVAVNLSYMIASWMLAAGELLAFCCLIGTLVGWNWGLKSLTSGPLPPPRDYNY